MKKIAVPVLRAMVAGRVLVLVAVLVIFGSYAWQLHFWVPAGRAVALGKWNFDGCDFQVWQRKTRYITEPFADGLFVRRGTNGWIAFCFDIQDNYRPTIELRKVAEKVLVFRAGENRGEFDMAAQVFRRNNQAMTPQFVLGDPPGDWWFQNTTN